MKIQNHEMNRKAADVQFGWRAAGPHHSSFKVKTKIFVTATRSGTCAAFVTLRSHLLPSAPWTDTRGRLQDQQMERSGV